MRISIITQEDSFVLPRNIELLASDDSIEIASIVALDVRGSLVNKKSLFARGFGVWQTARMGTYLIRYRAWDAVDRLLGYSLPGSKCSLRGVAKRYDIPYQRESSVKSKDFHRMLRALRLDLIVSFSAPLVFPPELLSIPSEACVNLHCSYLPEHSGLLPSFWALYHNEQYTGATVHLMDSRIDNGHILGQKKVAIGKSATMFDVITETKRVGGELMKQVIKQFDEGTVTQRQNYVDPNAYHSWPTIEELKEFRKRGGRLI